MHAWRQEGWCPWQACMRKAIGRLQLTRLTLISLGVAAVALAVDFVAVVVALECLALVSLISGMIALHVAIAMRGGLCGKAWTRRQGCAQSAVCSCKLKHNQTNHWMWRQNHTKMAGASNEDSAARLCSTMLAILCYTYIFLLGRSFGYTMWPMIRAYPSSWLRMSWKRSWAQAHLCGICTQFRQRGQSRQGRFL